MFKTAMKQQKQYILGLDFKIEKMDIIGMVHHAWAVSFGMLEFM